MSGKRKRKSKRKRKKKAKRVAGGFPLAEISLSLRSNLDSLFGLMETIGASARSAAWDHLTGHLFETIDRLCALALQKKDTVAAWRAAQALSVLVCRCIHPLIGIGSAKGGTIGKRWAGESLARVWVAIEKHTKTLSRVNTEYRKTKAKIGKLRRDIVAPSAIGQIVQEELAIGERYRHELLYYRRLLGKNRKSFRTQIVKPRQVEMYYKIPREYRRTLLKLPDFSVRSEGDWFREWIWPRIKKREAELLPKWQQGAKLRDEAKTGLYLKAFYSQCRNHLKALAKLRRVQ
jgi:hypothetical protein